MHGGFQWLFQLQLITKGYPINLLDGWYPLIRHRQVR